MSEPRPHRLSQTLEDEKILLIEVQAHRAVSLAHELARYGAEVTTAPGGFYALTMIERERPKVVVVGWHLHDMEPAELVSILRDDPALSGTAVVNYRPSGPAPPGAGAAELAATAGAFDLVLDGDLSSFALAARIADFCSRLPALPALPAPAERIAAVRPTSARQIGAAAASPQELSGSLGILDLMELSQALALGGKTGQLCLEYLGTTASISFERGRVIDAATGGRAGRAAFTEILRASLREKNIPFRFKPMTEMSTIVRSLDITVEHLLLSTAVAIDEAGESDGGASS